MTTEQPTSEVGAVEVEAVVREVGAWLAGRHRAEPVAARGRAEALAAFSALDAPAAALLRERLGALRPRAGWIESELASRVPVTGEWWLCDPIDGAVQYLLGQPHWAVTATLLEEGEAVLAVVHAPQLGFTYTAARGAGALLNGRRISPSGRALDTAVVATSHPPMVAEEDALALRRVGASTSAVLAAGVLGVRNLGPTALQVAQVGSGHLDAFWECGLDAPNLLGGALIAAEAGAVVSDHVGGPWLPGTSPGFLAAPVQQHGELVRVLSAVV
ncbi:inositol monophosphatase [Kitasatospora sp. NBC_01287]|uniref:inositol monophosphatase family protein n=1 Tax=Kitasatospora sp. NBC_01287 TaxID=2903573 RepID=UPI002255244A|nr:inositol monophosphatase family protein [Kitasatospora sp. NBC_01287]MCX4749371.1 inositol monophosphatase [Kitasatospora sp. NBC_01287]